MPQPSDASDPFASLPNLSDGEYRRLSSLIYESVGIKLPPSKRTLLESRTQKRLRALGVERFSDYCDYLFTEEGQRDELWQLVDVVTTNTTYFFRESQHFNILAGRVLPQLGRFSGSSPLRIWSAGCSTGEEPYTLAIVLAEYARHHPAFAYSILATDISSRVLQQASQGVYPESALKDVPAEIKRRYFLRGKGAQTGKVRVEERLREAIRFERLNFMSDFKLKSPRDIIFCRNVLIYFDRPTQQKLLSKFCDNLRNSGYLFIGHSENVSGMGLPLKAVAPATYQRT